MIRFLSNTLYFKNLLYETPEEIPALSTGAAGAAFVFYMPAKYKPQHLSHHRYLLFFSHEIDDRLHENIKQRNQNHAGQRADQHSEKHRDSHSLAAGCSGARSANRSIFYCLIFLRA